MYIYKVYISIYKYIIYIYMANSRDLVNLILKIAKMFLGNILHLF